MFSNKAKLFQTGITVFIAVFSFFFTHSVKADYITVPVHGVFVDTFSWNNFKPYRFFTDIYTNSQSQAIDCNTVKKTIPFTGTIEGFYLNTRQLSTITSATNTRVSILLNNNSTTTLLSSINIINRTDGNSTSTLNIPVLNTDTYCLVMEPLNSSYPGGTAVNNEFIGQILINTMSTTTVQFTDNQWFILNEFFRYPLIISAFILFFLVAFVSYQFFRR